MMEKLQTTNLTTDDIDSIDDVTPNINQVDDMASLLESQHGVFAAEVADFLATKHSIAGDAGRCWAWAGVAERVRMRTRQRIEQAEMQWF